MCLSAGNVDSLAIIGGLNIFLKLFLNQEHGEENVVKDFFEVDFAKIGTGFDGFEIFIHFQISAFRLLKDYQQKI